jgi:hypothetical protein
MNLLNLAPMSTVDNNIGTSYVCLSVYGLQIREDFILPRLVHTIMHDSSIGMPTLTGLSDLSRGHSRIWTSPLGSCNYHVHKF